MTGVDPDIYLVQVYECIPDEANVRVIHQRTCQN